MVCKLSIERKDLVECEDNAPTNEILKTIQYFKSQIYIFFQYSLFFLDSHQNYEELFIFYSTFQCILSYFIIKWFHFIGRELQLFIRQRNSFDREKIHGAYISDLYDVIGSEFYAFIFIEKFRLQKSTLLSSEELEMTSFQSRFLLKNCLSGLHSHLKAVIKKLSTLDMNDINNLSEEAMFIFYEWERMDSINQWAKNLYNLFGNSYFDIETKSWMIIRRKELGDFPLFRLSTGKSEFDRFDIAVGSVIVFEDFKIIKGHILK